MGGGGISCTTNKCLLNIYQDHFRSHSATLLSHFTVLQNLMTWMHKHKWPQLHVNDPLSHRPMLITASCNNVTNNCHSSSLLWISWDCLIPFLYLYKCAKDGYSPTLQQIVWLLVIFSQCQTVKCIYKISVKIHGRLSLSAACLFRLGSAKDWCSLFSLTFPNYSDQLYQMFVFSDRKSVV